MVGVPDEQDPLEPPGEPRLEIPWRSAWRAGALVVGLIAVFPLALWVAGSPWASSTGAVGHPAGRQATASPPVSTAPARRQPRHVRRVRAGAPLQPVRIHRVAGCPLSPPTILRVMQFNIHAGISRFGGLGIARIAAEIRAAAPDLVSLNEVDDGTTRSGHADEPAYLAAATGLRPVYGPNLFGYDGGRFGNAILSRYPVVTSRNTRLPDRPRAEPRGLLQTTLRVGGRTIAFDSVHLTQGRGHTASRVREALAVARLVSSTPYPTILAGDLNSRPGDLPVRILRHYLLDAQEYGGSGPGATVPEGRPVNRIDYILYDNHFAPLRGSTQVVPSESSDHRSLRTELVLRTPGQC